LVVGQGSQAIVRFKNDMVVEVQSQSSVFFEQLDYVLVTIQKGGLKVLEKGTGQHEVIMLKDGLLQDPEGRNIPAASLLKGDAAEEDEPGGTPPPPPQDSQTLSDAYISSIVQNQKGFMNRCYAQHLRNQPQSKGEIHLTFTILSGGDVSNVKVLKSTIDDKELQRCVLSALERAKFRGFEGSPIIVNYPVFFE
jgi:TonB family protein